MKVPSPNQTKTSEREAAPPIELREEPTGNLPAIQVAQSTHPASQAIPPSTASYSAKIIAAIARVTQKLGVIEKHGWNEFHKYNYAKMEDVLQALTPLIASEGLVFFQTEIRRSMFDQDKVIAIEYAFTIAHVSGDVWPDRPVQSGMARCRDSKGGFDDKSIAKAHTQARKYFLLAQFQIATDDMQDSDKDADGGGKATSRVPSPGGPPPADPPHYISAKTAAEFCAAFKKRVAAAPTEAEIDAIMKANTAALRLLSSEDNKAYLELGTEVGARRSALKKEEDQRPAAPNASTDPEKFLKWADDELAKIDEKARDSLGDVFTEIIEPKSAGLFPPDVEELMKIYRRHEARLAP